MKTLEQRIAALEATVATLQARVASLESGAGSSEIADDAELDSKYGDQQIRRGPSAKYWTGASFTGRRMSECSPEYLDALAKYKDACAHMAKKEPARAKYAEYDERDARRARGWARRLRAGWRPAGRTAGPAQGSLPVDQGPPDYAPPDYGAPPDDYGSPPPDDEIPF